MARRLRGRRMVVASTFTVLALTASFANAEEKSESRDLLLVPDAKDIRAEPYTQELCNLVRQNPSVAVEYDHVYALTNFGERIGAANDHLLLDRERASGEGDAPLLDLVTRLNDMLSRQRQLASQQLVSMQTCRSPKGAAAQKTTAVGQAVFLRWVEFPQSSSGLFFEKVTLPSVAAAATVGSGKADLPSTRSPQSKFSETAPQVQTVPASKSKSLVLPASETGFVPLAARSFGAGVRLLARAILLRDEREAVAVEWGIGPASFPLTFAVGSRPPRVYQGDPLRIAVSARSSALADAKGVVMAPPPRWDVLRREGLEFVPAAYFAAVTPEEGGIRVRFRNSGVYRIEAQLQFESWSGQKLTKTVSLELTVSPAAQVLSASTWMRDSYQLNATTGALPWFFTHGADPKVVLKELSDVRILAGSDVSSARSVFLAALPAPSSELDRAVADAFARVITEEDILFLFSRLPASNAERSAGLKAVTVLQLMQTGGSETLEAIRSFTFCTEVEKRVVAALNGLRVGEEALSRWRAGCERGAKKVLQVVRERTRLPPPPNAVLIRRASDDGEGSVFPNVGEDTPLESAQVRAFDKPVAITHTESFEVGAERSDAGGARPLRLRVSSRGADAFRILAGAAWHVSGDKNVSFNGRLGVPFLWSTLWVEPSLRAVSGGDTTAALEGAVDLNCLASRLAPGTLFDLTCRYAKLSYQLGWDFSEKTLLYGAAVHAQFTLVVARLAVTKRHDGADLSAMAGLAF